MNVKIEESWRCRLQEEYNKPYFKQLTDFVRYEYAHEHVLPQGSQIFHMFNACPFEKVKVVILGQDPYPTPGLYYGVCFSVPEGTAIPASLMNIFKEIHQDLGKPIPSSGNLDRWVEQGVFSMNSVLTVRAYQTGSHRNRGWETFTDAVINLVPPHYLFITNRNFPHQSISFNPLLRKYSFALLKCLQPKKP